MQPRCAMRFESHIRETSWLTPNHPTVYESKKISWAWRCWSTCCPTSCGRSRQSRRPLPECQGPTSSWPSHEVRPWASGAYPGWRGILCRKDFGRTEVPKACRARQRYASSVGWRAVFSISHRRAGNRLTSGRRLKGRRMMLTLTWKLPWASSIWLYVKSFRKPSRNTLRSQHPSWS